MATKIGEWWDDVLLGDSGADVLAGLEGSDTLDGGAGADTLIGGAGDDSYVVDNAGDQVKELPEEGVDTVFASVNHSLAANVENLTLTGSAVVATGNGLDNTLTGNAAANTLIGGLGNDSYVVSTGDVVSEAAGEGTDTVVSDVTWTLGANLENLTLTGLTSINGTGNTLDNWLVGNDGNNVLTGDLGNDTLSGGVGFDTLIGGAGNDTYILDFDYDTVVEASGAGTDTVRAAISYTVAANVENVVLTGTADIDATGDGANNLLIGNHGANSLVGLAGTDTLIGGGGNDWLDGGAGVDTMWGGLGDDTYVLDAATDVVSEGAGEGTDTLIVTFTHTLATNFENLILSGTGTIHGTGNAQDNLLVGNGVYNSLNGGAGNDTLDGGGGTDTLVGGTGDDLYFIDVASDFVTEGLGAGYDTVVSQATYTLTTNVEKLILDGSAAIHGTGNTLDNWLVGNAAINSLSGLGGNDTLDGGAGADTMIGGAGNDVYFVDNAGDVVTEALGTDGTADLVYASVDFTLTANVEHLVLTGSAANGTGNASGNSLYGNDASNLLNGQGGNDTLYGGGGADTLIGGTGDDVYIIDDTLDTIVEGATDGTADKILAWTTVTLATNVENVTLMGGGGISAIGNTANNVMLGNDGDNYMSGGDGADSISGGSGDDTLDGGNGNDSLAGGDGNDTLIGAAGTDTMVGGMGDDVYYVDATTDVVVEGGTTDGNNQSLGSEGVDLVYASVNYTLGAEVEHLTLTGTAVTGTGNAWNNVLTGHSGNNSLVGLGGDDTLIGGGGTDTMIGGTGNDSYYTDGGDVITEALDEGNDTVFSTVTMTLTANLENLTLQGSSTISGTGNASDNILTGNAATNTLDGAGGNDTLDGGGGADRLVGGAGDDVYKLRSGLETVVEAAAGGIDHMIGEFSFALAAEVEIGTLDGSGDFSLTGNAGNNTLNGNWGNNTLSGGAGTDTMYGYGGDDVYVVDVAGDLVSESAFNGTDTVLSSINYTLGAEVENLTLTGTAVLAVGNELANTLTGNAATNTLRGMAGNDTYVIGAGDIVDETTVGSGGTDTVVSAITYTLPTNVENLLLTGTANVNGVGNALDNTLTGNAGANTLTGLGGNDTYYVGSGDVVDETSGASGGTDTVVVSFSYALGSNVENLILEGYDNLDGTGNALDNTLTGNLGVNTLTGLAGNDTYVVHNEDDFLIELAGGGTDTVQAWLDWTLAANFENLTLAGTANLRGTGTSGSNVLTGNSGNNTLNGAGGADTMIGGLGDDTYVTDGGDLISEAASAGIDTVVSAVTYTLGANLENLVLTGTANLNGTGNADANTLTGNAGANTLTGLGGNDTYVVGAGDVVVEAAAGGTDTVMSSVSWSLGAEFENLTLIGSADINATGNALANTITGNAGANSLIGGVGNDVYVITDALDVVVEGAAEGTADRVEAWVNHQLAANVEHLALFGTATIGVGNASANSLTGNDGDNYLDGQGGIDTMVGGLGNDTYIVDSTDIVTEVAEGGIDTVRASVTHTLAANVENLVLTGTASINGTGNALDNTLTGNAGVNSLTGGLGNDTYVVGVGDVLVEALGAGTDTVMADYSFTLAANFENLTLIGLADIDGTGNAADNWLVGNMGVNLLSGAGGNDTLDGGGGADILFGGAGDDTYLVNNTGVLIAEESGQGTDLVISTISFTLAAGSSVENLTLSGDGHINGTGNALANTITGNDRNNLLLGGAGDDTLFGMGGNDTLDGGDGTDTLYGGYGNDTYIVSSATTVISEASGQGIDTVRSYLNSYTLALSVENLTLMGSAVAGGGNAASNVLVGNSGNNILEGLDGADTLNGGGGVDTLYGGRGDDVYIVDMDDVIVEQAGEGIDTVRVSANYTLSNAEVENLTLTGSANLSGTGHAGDNLLIGNGGNNVLSGMAGNDTLNGAGGTDTLIGGTGDDVYVINDFVDLVVESLGEGTDTVWTGVDHTLAANVENLVLTGYDELNGTGNTLANTITGNDAANSIDGGDGADTLIGGFGDDTYGVDNAGDLIIETEYQGTDTVRASVSYVLGDYLENLTLIGSAVTATGNAGNNILTGNASANTLIGGLGDDSYVVGTGDVVVEAANEGTDTVISDISWTLGSNLENLRLTGSADINATGNGLANTLWGNDGLNSLIGGAGDDTYVIDQEQDVIVETAGQGTDTVLTSLDGYTLTANVEIGELTGDYAISLIGNGLANTLAGNYRDNTLDGGTGADTLLGHDGNDTYVVDNAGDVLIELAGEGWDTVVASINYTLGAEVEGLALTGAAVIGIGNGADNLLVGSSIANTLQGLDGHDTLLGGAGDDLLEGGLGNDVLDGESGNDTLAGGQGDDLYRIDAGGDLVIENAGEGTDTIEVSVSFTLAANLENLTLTGTSHINGTGNGAANLITGNVGDNTLDGGAGADTLIGGHGDDSYVVDDAGDLVVEWAGGGTDTVFASSTHVLGDDIERLVLTGSASVNGTGNALANTLIGNADANTLSGGAGDDVYYIGTGDVVVENAAGGIDTVYSAESHTLAANVEVLVLTGSANADGTGNSGDNTLIGNLGVNTLRGGAGNDTYLVNSPLDIVVENVSEGIDTLQVAANNVVLQANIENLVLLGTQSYTATGNSANNTLTGNSGDNSLDGGAGTDTLIGGLGDDTYTVDATDVVIEAAGEGTDTIRTALNWTLAANIENLTLLAGAVTGTGNAADNLLTGNSAANTLVGGDGNDTLNGGAGIDRLVGSNGDDLYFVEGADVLVEAASAGIDTVRSTISFTLATNFENLTLLTGAKTATGNSVGNVLIGNNSANTLDGAAGADTMLGGGGDDTYVVDNVGDLVSESEFQGTDTVQSSVSYLLGQWLENLVLTGSANLTGTGNLLANSLTGNGGSNVLTGLDGNDTLSGGAGLDTLIGGTGDDVYVIGDSDILVEQAGEGTDRVQSSINWTLAANFENLTLTGTAAQGTGNAANNIMVGNASANTLSGGDGDDSIDGGAGADRLLGGTGDDVYLVDNASDLVIELADQGTDTVVARVNHVLAANVERLTLDGLSNLTGTGNTLDNVITGNSGANQLNGGAGNDTLIGGLGNDRLDGNVGDDTMIGGEGNDIYTVDSSFDIVIELAGQGIDTVKSGVAWTLGAETENLILTGSAVHGVGNDLDNTLTGTTAGNTLEGKAGNDTLDGGTGADTLIGGTGNDTYIVDNLLDLVVEAAGEGTDTVRSSVSYTLADGVENLVLTLNTTLSGTGNAGDNVIIGSASHNKLTGLGGADTLTGGAGADQFRYTAVSDGGDTITDFVRGTDRLVFVASAFGGLPTGALAAGRLAYNAAGDADDRFVFNTVTGALSYDADGNGAGASVLIATLVGRTSLSGSDFLIVAS